MSVSARGAVWEEQEAGEEEEGEVGGRRREKDNSVQMERVLPGSQPSLISDLWQGGQGHTYPHLPPAHWPGEGRPPFLPTTPGRARLVERACKRGGGGRRGGLSVGELRVTPREPHLTHLLEGTITINTEVVQTLSRVLGFRRLHDDPALGAIAERPEAWPLPKVRGHCRPGCVSVSLPSPCW